MSFVTFNQFYGMDINFFAVELAKITLIIAKKVVIALFNLTEVTLDLNILNNNIICNDALLNDWIKADAIIGNPPFLRSRNIRLTFGDEYSDRLF